MHRAEQRILIVDDSVYYGSLLQRTLTDVDHPIIFHQACSTAEALIILKDYSPDIVLLDLKIPGERSLDILHAIQESHPHTVVILLSEMTDDFYNAYYLQKGAHFLFDKASEIDKITKTVYQLR